MRTTITLDDDAFAIVEARRRVRGTGISSVVNDLIREAAAAPAPRPRFVQRTSQGHARIDVSDAAAVLDLLEGSHTP